MKPCTKPCVFIGNSLNYKGYHCLDIPSGKIFLSRHVTFDESSFPFQKSVTPQPVAPSPSTTVFIFAAWFQPASNSPPSILVQYHPPSQLLSCSSSQPGSSHPAASHHTITSAVPHQHTTIITPHQNTPAVPHLYTITAISHQHIATAPTSAMPNSSSQLPLLVTTDPDTVSPNNVTTSPTHEIQNQIVQVDTTASQLPPPILPTSTHQMVTKSKSGISKKKIYLSTKHPTDLPSNDYYDSFEPASFIEVSKSTAWRQAMSDEFSALQRQQT